MIGLHIMYIQNFIAIGDQLAGLEAFKVAIFTTKMTRIKSRPIFKLKIGLVKVNNAYLGCTRGACKISYTQVHNWIGYRPSMLPFFPLK